MHRREFLIRVGCGGVASIFSRIKRANGSILPLALARHTLDGCLDYLSRQQADDGGWHSETYAVMRSGQSLTPFVLNAMMALPKADQVRHQQCIWSAYRFVRSQVQADGSVGTNDPEILEYPVHSTALSLHCMLQTNDSDDRIITNRMIDYLLRAQYQPVNGFSENHLAFGAWGFAPPHDAVRADHVDLSHTRTALQALRLADDCRVVAACQAMAFVRARRFLRLVQRSPEDKRPHPQPIDWPDEGPSWNGTSDSFDGGFYFSPIVLTANKGGWSSSPTHWRSYATSTCDGVLALLASGCSPSDQRVVAAVDWLARHPRLDFPEGILEEHPEAWGQSIQHYHLASRATVYAALHWCGNWRQQIVALIAGNQAADGSIRNRTSHLMKEDDPILCTALAVKAISEVLASSS